MVISSRKDTAWNNIYTYLAFHFWLILSAKTIRRFAYNKPLFANANDLPSTFENETYH